jgi:hypothetical protein
MTMQAQMRQSRQATPARWQKAARRAVDEGIEVRQVNENGMWVANSGTQANVAYLLEIGQGVVRSCSCPAGQFGDPCCKHAARYYLDAGVLELDSDGPEDTPPAPAAVECRACNGCGQCWYRSGYALPCAVCKGTGYAPLVAQAAALVASAEAAEGRPAAVAEPDPLPFDAEPEADMEYVGRAGHIAGYDVLIAGDRLLVTHAASGCEWRHVVPNYGTALSQLAQEPGLRLGWARFPDEAEAIYLYDAEDGNFGYALNLSDPGLSEWGYAPFVDDEDGPACDACGGPLDDDAHTDDALQCVCAACLEASLWEAEKTLAAAIADAHEQAMWEREQLVA